LATLGKYSWSIYNLKDHVTYHLTFVGGDINGI